MTFKQKIKLAVILEAKENEERMFNDGMITQRELETELNRLNQLEYCVRMNSKYVLEVY